MKIIVVNGPNLNMLGIREPEIYGAKTYRELESYIKSCCGEFAIECEIYQSNCEGELVNIIQNAYGNADGIIINAAAYTHTSIAILDALRSVALPAVEVHLSDINAREEFRKLSYLGMYCERSFIGKGFESYREAIYYMKEHILK